MRSCRKVEVTYDQLHVKGGLLAKSSPIIAKRIQVGANAKWFAKIATTEKWLLMATTGFGVLNSSFRRTSLPDTLREKVEQACNGGIETKASLDESDYDPMVELDFDDSHSPKKTSGQGLKRQRYYHNHAKNRIAVINMPVYCPEQVADCKEMREITLFIQDRRQIWLCIDDVEWAIRYLYVQNQLKGVSLVSPDSQGPSGDVHH